MKNTKLKTSDILRWPGSSLDFSSGPLIMGILNVTPDSFSDGGLYFDTGNAVEHGLKMITEGAAIIDIGGQSSRPGSEPISAEKQIERVVPVIKKMREKTTVPISIDTDSSEVAKAAIEAGASIINDITSLSDIHLGELAAEHQLPVVLMHMQGMPATMQAEPKYNDVVSEVLQYLLSRAEYAEKLGITREKIFIDPGIGFGKTLEHNLLLMKNLEKFVQTGYRILLGTSRKAFIGRLTNRSTPAERIFGTAATVSMAVIAGVSVVRVHDVAAMNDVVKVTQAII